MEQSSVNQVARQVVGIPRGERWQAYQRLQSLGIACWCTERGDLQVEVNSPLAAIQVWSAIGQLTRPRRDLAVWLDRCWQLKFNKTGM
ncbi:hypothetical protein H6S82_07415 [Planktothrix sp. FACHB-1355]|uniref:Uncharacterized protein n=1 Tax=Aerosakkonema funiforme FACHB-1375 TaxID=2949571 RepID=A0A926VFQ3_9CYAN|nr:MULTISPECIES: Asr1405/Asl0597 family protein [Oscillatoriales]MBD2183116.1 hypothetical protein [Aerosakkonema funiforme FACHB-1375]MBD3558682.1 hypothetical protein [Planktothrix sp. FACHB-1355]